MNQEILDGIHREFHNELANKKLFAKAVRAKPNTDFEKFELKVPLILNMEVDQSLLDPCRINGIILAHDYSTWVGWMLDKYPHWEHMMVNILRDEEHPNRVKWVSYDRFTE